MSGIPRKRSAKQSSSVKKGRFVPIPAQVSREGSSASAANVTAETHSYEVYSLPSGRLGMRQNSSTVPITPSQVAAPLDQGETPADLLVSAVLDGFPVDQAEGLIQDNTANPTADLRKLRKRPELRAAAKIREWLPLREDFLDEVLCYFGGEHPIDTQVIRCPECDARNATVRCTECDTRRLLCPQCILAKHQDLSLHWLEEWNGKTFLKRSLRALGHVVQLGHGGAACSRSDEKVRTIVVGDITGIHKVNVIFCSCINESGKFDDEWTQLMRRGWFPASTNQPATAFTFRVLDHFQELNFQGKTSLYDFWKTMERLTDNSGRLPPIDRYKQLSHVVRIWRHLVSLKRGGRAHDPAGARGTQQGELALECPACPQPGKNLPNGWEDAPPHIRWLYTLFLMLDANFKVKLRSRGLDDVEIAPGWSYFVEESDYVSYMNKAGNQPEETSTCSAEHKAILNANLRREGYLASGIGAVLCARHAMIRKNGVGDVHNGEKYCIMDYLICSTLIGLTFVLLLISYDIACQWHRNLPTRLKKNVPPDLQLDLERTEARYAIPKKHIRVHGANHSQFSFNYLPYVGRTYSEYVEAAWSHFNPISASARDMSPGMRHEVLNDHFGAWNWQKIIAIASTFCVNLKEAHEMFVAQLKNFEDYSATFRPEVVERWEQAVKVWIEDKTQTDPYEEKRETVTLKSVRKSIAEEEEKDLGNGVPSPHEVTQGLFIQMGLDLEEQQRKLRARAQGVTNGDCTLAQIQEKRNILRHRIELWQSIQDAHMPVAAQFRHSRSTSGSIASAAPHSLAALPGSAPAASTRGPATVPLNSTAAPPVRAEHMPLLLPSAFPVAARTSSLVPSLCDKERRLQLAQADDALEEVRRLRRIITGLNEFKWLNLTGTGQRAGTRLRGSFAAIKARLDLAADRYRVARAALLVLDSDGDWTTRLKELHDGDLRGPRHDSDDDLRNIGQGYVQPSWIWTVPRAPGQPLESGDPDEFSESMRVEWARAKARAQRWGEEERLLEEEMRRVIVYFEWRARWWRLRARTRPNAPLSVARGLAAYAEKQAMVWEGLAERCAQLWVPLLRGYGKVPEWASRYSLVTADGTNHPKRRRADFMYEPSGVDEQEVVEEWDSDGDMDHVFGGGGMDEDDVDL